MAVNTREVEKALKGMKYPAHKDDLLKCAEGNNAEEAIRQVIQSLPEDEFNTPIDVTKAIGEMDRGARRSQTPTS